MVSPLLNEHQHFEYSYQNTETLSQSQKKKKKRMLSLSLFSLFLEPLLAYPPMVIPGLLSVLYLLSLFLSL